MSNQDAELLELVRSLTDRVESLEVEIKQLRLLNADVPEETMVAIARRAAYLEPPPSGAAGPSPSSEIWRSGTRRRQHSHDPLHLR